MKCDNRKLTHAERERLIAEAERHQNRQLTEAERDRLIAEAERSNRTCRPDDDNALMRNIMYGLGLFLAGLLGYYLFRNLMTRHDVRQEPVVTEQRRDQVVNTTATPVEPARTVVS